jgi:anthranilate/para-aminobenzoate synthase component II
MAITHRSHPTFGLQFHPESILTPQGYDLIRAFLDRIDPLQRAA